MVPLYVCTVSIGTVQINYLEIDEGYKIYVEAPLTSMLGVTNQVIL